MIVISDVSGVDSHLNTTNPHQIPSAVIPLFASEAQMDEGVSTGTIVSPAELKRYFANNQPAAPNVPNFANSSEIDDGTSTSTIIHPAGLKRYFDANLPVIPTVPSFATAAQIIDGSSTNTIVSPAELKNYVELTAPPIIEFASSAEIDAGEAEDKIVNPAELKRYVAQQQPQIPIVPSFANTALVNAGTSTSTIVSPAELAKYVAAQKPIVPSFASASQIDAGLSTDTIVNPAQLKRYVELKAPVIPTIPSFASTAQVNSGTSTNTIINPLELKKVLDTRIPTIPQFASNAVVDAGTSTTTIISPAQLKRYLENNQPAAPDVPDFASEYQVTQGTSNDLIVSPLGLKQFYDSKASDFPKIAEYSEAIDVTNHTTLMTPRWVHAVMTSSASASDLAKSTNQLVANRYVSPKTLRAEITRLKVSPMYDQYIERLKEHTVRMPGITHPSFPGYKVETVSLDLDLWTRHLDDTWKILTNEIGDNYKTGTNSIDQKSVMGGEIALRVWAKSGSNFVQTKIANDLGNKTNFYFSPVSYGTATGGVALWPGSYDDEDSLEDRNYITDTYEFQIQLGKYHSPAHAAGSTLAVTGSDIPGKISGRLKNAQTVNGHLGVESDPDNKYPVQFGLWTNRIKEGIVFSATSAIGDPTSFTVIDLHIKVRNSRTNKFIASWMIRLNLLLI